VAQTARTPGKEDLAISPHPDDESIGCGGLLLSHVGYSENRIVNVYNGDGGGALEEGPWRDDPAYRTRLANLRRRELDEVAGMLRASGWFVSESAIALVFQARAKSLH
jgi:LmbE family N-acetylglucosaminyl deacetylase